MRDGGDAAAQPDGGDRCRDGRAARMGRLPANDAQNALAQRQCHLSLRGRRVKDEFVDDERRIRPDIQRCLVDEEQLHAAGRGCLDLFVGDDLSAELDDAQRASRRNAG
jgi:hypothetical protein